MSEQEQNYEDMTAEQLEELMGDPNNLIIDEAAEEQPDEPEAEREPEPEEEPVEAESSGEEQPEQEESESEDAAEAPTEDEVSELDLIKARLELMEAENKKHESVAGRMAGESGFYKQQLEKALQELNALRQQPQGRARNEAESEDEYPEIPWEKTRTMMPQPPQQNNREFEAWATQQAVSQAAMQFRSSKADWEEIAPEIGKYLDPAKEQIQAIIERAGPVEASQQTTRILEAAYAQAVAARHAIRVKEMQERRAAQVSSLQKKKVAASSSRSGSAPPARPKPKSVDEMSVEELDAALDREHAHLGWGRR